MTCPTLLCFAMDEEAKGLSSVVSLSPWNKILVTGIGRENTKRSVTAFLSENSIKRVFTCGFAGGLNPDLSTGDVLFTTEDTSLAEKLAAAGASPVKFFCAPKIATTVAEKQELRRTTGADVVEMESEVVHEICRERGIPCATVRVISDTASEDLPLDFNELSKPDMSIDFGKLGIAILKNPVKIKALLRLQKNTSFAAKRLGEVLEKVAAH